MEVPRAAGHDGYIWREVKSPQMSCASIGVAVLLKPNVELEPCTTGQRHAERRLARRKLVTMGWIALGSHGSYVAAFEQGNIFAPGVATGLACPHQK
jgi:hypothetical protein